MSMAAIEEPVITRALIPGAKASTVEVRLPEELEPGKSITGSVFVDNVGDAPGKIGSLIHCLWDDEWYGGYIVNVPPGGRCEFTVPEGLIEMPDQDANMKILGGVLQDGWEAFRQDDEVSWTVKKLVPEVPWPRWIWAGAAGGASLIVVVGAVAYQEDRRRQEMMMLLAR